MVKTAIIRAFLSFSENLKIRVRISTLGFSEPRKKRQKSIKFSVFNACNICSFSAELENPWKLGTPRDTVYSRGKGAHKQKSERYRPR